MDINIEEAKAIEAASPAIGEYLEQIGKTDLAVMTEEEWLGFLAHAYAATCDQVRELWKDAVPF
jgi:archaellum component FlaD/FlaE